MTSIKWLLLLGTAAAAACTSDSAAGPPAPPCNATLATDLALGSHWCHRRAPARRGNWAARCTPARGFTSTSPPRPAPAGSPPPPAPRPALPDTESTHLDSPHTPKSHSVPF